MLHALDTGFSHKVCFYFSNLLLIIGSDSPEALKPDNRHFDRFESAMLRENHTEYLLYSSPQ
jgi:hypothetical protein